MSFEGYADELLNPDDEPDEDIQDHIFHLLIQIVHEPEGLLNFVLLRDLITSPAEPTGHGRIAGINIFKMVRFD